MKLTEAVIESVVQSMFRRCDEARAAGGIAERDRVNGTDIPAGWKIDHHTMYWLPSNVALF